MIIVSCYFAILTKYCYICIYQLNCFLDFESAGEQGNAYQRTQAQRHCEIFFPLKNINDENCGNPERW